jgi:hypothetical protein
MDARKMAADIRLEASRLQEEVKRMRQAADLLDPPQTINASVAIHASAEVDTSPEVKTSDESPRGTIVEIVVASLKKAGVALPKDALFEQVRTQGGRVADIKSFTSALSRAKLVVYLGDGLWDLTERHQKQTSESTPPVAVEGPTGEQIREFLRNNSARISTLTRHFRTSEESIRKIVEEPSNNITVNGPGWLVLKPVDQPSFFSSGGK